MTYLERFSLSGKVALVTGGARGIGAACCDALTEAGALQLARNEWNNPTQRNLKKIEWQTWAQEKYRRLR